MKKHEDNEVIEEFEEQLEQLRINQQPINKWHLLDKVQTRFNPIQRSRQCSTVPIRGTKVITFCSFKDGSKSIYGTNKCGGKLCVVCSSHATAKHTEFVSSMLDKSFRYEIPVYFSTFTIARSNSIEHQFKSIGKIQTEFKRRLKKKLIQEFGVGYNYIFNKDFTFSKDKRKGTYHTHLHCLFFLSKPLHTQNKAGLTELIVDNTRARFEDIATRLWVETTQHFGIRSNEQSQDVQIVKEEMKDKISDYVVKISKDNQKISYEVSRNSTKHSKQGNSFGLFEMMNRIYQSNNKDWSLIHIYKEFTQFCAGKQFFSKSKKMSDWIAELNPLKSNTEEDIEDLEVDIVEEEEREKFSIDMSTTLYKLLLSLELRGQIFDVMEGHWNNNHIDQREKMKRLCDHSIELNPHCVGLLQLGRLACDLNDFLVSLIDGGLVGDYHLKSFQRILRRDLTS
jgi:hypothetical protein